MGDGCAIPQGPPWADILVMRKRRRLGDQKHPQVQRLVYISGPLEKIADVDERMKGMRCASIVTNGG